MIKFIKKIYYKITNVRYNVHSRNLLCIIATILGIRYILYPMIKLLFPVFIAIIELFGLAAKIAFLLLAAYIFIIFFKSLQANAK